MKARTMRETSSERRELARDVQFMVHEAVINAARHGGAKAVEVRVEATEPVTFWVDEEPYEGQNSALVQLSAGRHRITVRVPAGSGAAPTLRVELRKPADSQANFEMVTGGE